MVMRRMVILVDGVAAGFRRIAERVVDLCRV